MIIEFIFTGKTSDKWVEEGCLNYLKRITHYMKAEVKIINFNFTGISPAIQKKKEAALILEKISGKDFMVLLDERGKQFTSEEFAGQMNRFTGSGKAKLIFIIGGPFGSDVSLQQRADMLLSFSKMTFTHQMIRLILTEQVYRAFTILNNEKYHHQG
jgi:23S rRNA (pseudouridine1915-N3)-methyltransferase